MKKLIIGIVILFISCIVNAQGNKPQSFPAGKYKFTVLGRDYGVYVPYDYTKNEKETVSVIVYLHGGGGDSNSAYADNLDLYARKHKFFLAMPEAKRLSWWSKASTRWNGGCWEGGCCCGGDTDDVAYISEIIDDLRVKFNIGRVYAMGISNGGLMVNRLACELSDKITAIATVAPTAIPTPCKPSILLSVMNIHGTEDPCNPYDGSNPAGICGAVDYKRMPPVNVVASWRDYLNCFSVGEIRYKYKTVTCISYSNTENAFAEVVFCTVEGMGHTWPSGSQYMPERIIGLVSYDISMDQIWEFFKSHHY